MLNVFDDTLSPVDIAVGGTVNAIGYAQAREIVQKLVESAKFGLLVKLRRSFVLWGLGHGRCWSRNCVGCVGVKISFQVARPSKNECWLVRYRCW